MHNFRFTDEQIMAIPAEQEWAMASAEVCCLHNLKPATFCKWKAKHGDMDVSDACKLKTLEAENAWLKEAVG